MADTKKHSNCRDVVTGRCLCGTCKNDHDQIGDTPPCCIKFYGYCNCPITRCEHYEKETNLAEQPYEIELYDNVPGQVIPPLDIPEREIPDDWDI